MQPLLESVVALTCGVLLRAWAGGWPSPWLEQIESRQKTVSSCTVAHKNGRRGRLGTRRGLVTCQKIPVPAGMPFR